MATTYYLSDDETNYAITPGFIANEKEIPVHGLDKAYIIQNTIDFADRNIYSSNDEIVQALSLPANTLVLMAWAEVLTVDAGITDLDLGRTGDADGWLDGFSGATAGIKLATLGTLFGVGDVLTAADTIDITINVTATVDTLKIKVKALCVKLD